MKKRAVEFLARRRDIFVQTITVVSGGAMHIIYSTTLHQKDRQPRSVMVGHYLDCPGPWGPGAVSGPVVWYHTNIFPLLSSSFTVML